MLQFDLPMTGRIDKTRAGGADVLICRKTMRGRMVTEREMHGKIGDVRAGVIEILGERKQGWLAIRP
jgi:intracellular sulfur oxidation DsrE/DsrF family protein